LEGDHLNNSIEREKIGRAFGGHGKKRETGSEKETVDMGV
jgi:hypothetical protein